MVKKRRAPVKKRKPAPVSLDDHAPPPPRYRDDALVAPPPPGHHNGALIDGVAIVAVAGVGYAVYHFFIKDEPAVVGAVAVGPDGKPVVVAPLVPDSGMAWGWWVLVVIGGILLALAMMRRYYPAKFQKWGQDLEQKNPPALSRDGVALQFLTLAQRIDRMVAQGADKVTKFSSDHIDNIDTATAAGQKHVADPV
jgi:hypothetical protein